MASIVSGKTNSGLVAYAKAQVGLPYWYGTYGQTASSSLYSSKKKQYPSYYTASDFSKQYGKRVHDCVGLIKGYIWSSSATATPKYNSAQDVSAKGMYSASSQKGKISTFPKHNGMLLYKGSSISSIHHVGVYCTDGYVYEAKGHAYGVLKTKYSSSDWPYWSQCPYIKDDSSSSSSSSSGTTSGSGSGSSSGSTKYTATLTVNGEWDTKTTKRLQTVMGTTVDGTIDGQYSSLKKYWAAINSSVCKWNGGTSEVVKAWQKYLINKGYSCGSDGADGKLGQQTAKASQRFLIAKGYSCGSAGVDGKFATCSAKALQKWLNAQ